MCAKIKYETKGFYGKALDIIAKANAIIANYETQGYTLTLRQLYYQFVSLGFCPNTNSEYKRLGEVVSAGRRAGLIDWNAIVDRTRFMRTKSSWLSPSHIIKSCANQYAEDLWADQDAYVELWFEKDALLAVFERAAEQRRLPLLSCRGYNSDSICWQAAQRLQEIERTKKVVILHFGDHDPSGLDMSRDIEARLNLFGASPTIKRLALTIAQVRKYNPPPNPAKETDSRFAAYQAEFGDESWELDALSPDVLVALVDKEVSKHIDTDRWSHALEREALGRRQLAHVSKRFTAIMKRAKVS